MKRAFITINFTRRLNIFQNLDFELIIAKHITKQNIEQIKDQLIKSKINSLYIEHICFSDYMYINEFILLFSNENIKVTIVTLNKNDINELKKYNVSNLINIKDQNFEQEVLKIESIKNEEVNEIQKTFFLDNIKANVNITIGLSFDNKVYQTTYLLNLAKFIAQQNKTSSQNVLFVEKQQSLINYNKIIDLQNLNIDYKSIENIDDINGQNLNNKNIIIDLGCVKDKDLLNKLLYYPKVNIILFSTNCKKVLENEFYIDNVRKYEKNNNVLIIKRNEIFDKIIQSNKSPFRSKVIKKNIYKNILGEKNVNVFTNK